MPGLVPFVYGELKYGTTFSYCPSGWTLGESGTMHGNATEEM